MKSFQQFLVIGLASVGLSACVTKPYQQASDNVEITKDQIHAQMEHADETAPAVKDQSGYYVNAAPIPIATKPAWLKQEVVMHANHMPLDLLMSRLLRGTNITPSYDSSVQAGRPVMLNYTGTIEGALANIAAQTDYEYSVDGHDLNWSAFATKTFNISFMPGASNYMVGQKQGANTSAHQNFQGAYGNNTNVANSALNDDQYSNLHADLSVWRDLRDTLNRLKSKQGDVMVSESTTTVTVHDRPENVRAMSRYIKQMNAVLSQEVAIKVRVLDVDLNNASNYGINWNVVARTLHTDFKVFGNLSNATNLIATQLGAGPSDNNGMGGIQIGSDNSNAIINALAEQGKVRVVNQPQVTTLNNQIATIKITQDTGYVQSLTSSTTFNGVVANSINPGTVTEGLTLYLLPKVRDDFVYLQISSTISNLLKLDKVSDAPEAERHSSHDTRNQNYQAIQVPTITNKSFNQRSMVRSGNTLIIAGYKRLKDETKSASMFTIDPLGGKGMKAQQSEMVVLITPVIVNNGVS